MPLSASKDSHEHHLYLKMFRDEILYSNLLSLVPKVLHLIRPALNKILLPKSVENYPVLEYLENNFPKIGSYPAPREVAQVFRGAYGAEGPAVDLASFPEYQNAMAHIMVLPEMISYNRPNNRSQSADRVFEACCMVTIESVIERYYYLHGTEFNLEKFNDIYQPIENFVYNETLDVDISVPILAVQFDLDDFELLPGVSLRRIPDGIQRSRSKIKSYTPAIPDLLVMAATHELIIHGKTCKKAGNIYQDPFRLANVYENELFEHFFSSLKIATDFTSGYAQVLIHPLNWAESYSADLPNLRGVSVRKYPLHFDNYYWLSDSFPLVKSDKLHSLKSVFQAIVNSKKNQILFALKRFHKSTMRSEEEDIIIDLIIALEMLLSDNEKGEITHKLALRLSVMLGKFNPESYEALAVFKNVKKIYAYRSQIVHGSQKASSGKEIQISENISVPVVLLANSYLRELLNILLLNPAYLIPSEIDKLLLTGPNPRISH
jgi:hypothetical protein